MAGSVTKELLLLFRADGQNALQEMNLLKMSISEFTAPLNALTDHLQTMGMEFESNMANVNTLINVSKDELQSYSDELVNMSLRVPQSAAKLSDALYQALSAGIPKEQALDFTESASKAATAGLTNTFTAVDAGTSVMNAFGMSAKDSGKIFDLMFQTVKDGKITFEQLGSQIGMVAPSAAAAGVSLEQMMAAISTTTGQLRPEQAITGISSALAEMNTSGSKAEKALNKLGYANLKTALQTNTLQGIFAQMTASGMKMNDVFGQEGSRAANILGNSYEIATKQLQNSMNAAGATEAAFSIIDETLAVKMEKRKNAQDALALQIAKTLEPAEKLWLDVQTKLLGVLAESPDTIKKIAGVTLGVASVTSKAANGALGMAAGFKSILEIKEKYIDKAKKAADATTSLADASGKAAQASKGMASGLGTVALGAGAVIAAMLLAASVYDDWIAKKEKLEKENDARVKNNVEGYKKDIDFIKKTQEATIRYQNASKFDYGREKQAFLVMRKTYEEQFGIKLSDNLDIARQQTNELLVQKEIGLKKAQELADSTQKQADIDKKATDDRLTQLNNLAAKLKGLGIEFEVDPAGDLDKQLKQATKLLDDYKQRIKDRAATAQEATRKANLDWRRMQLGDDLEALRQLELLELEYQYEMAQNQAQSDAERFALLEKYGIDQDLLNADFNDRKLKQSKTADERLYDAQIQAREIAAGQNKDLLKQIELEELDHKEKLALQDVTSETLRLAIQQEFANKRAELSRQEDDMLMAKVELGKTVLDSFASSLGNSMNDAGEAWKAGAKSILIGIADFLEKELLGADLNSIIQAIFNPSSLIKNAPLLLAGYAGLEAFKAGVASFDVGGIPTNSGYGMLHKGDVVVNPTSDNAMMEMLTDRLAAKINGQGARFVIELDGRTVAENTVKHVNQIDRGLPRGKSVLDKGRYA